jgi:outer membrane lipoprotein-sorting protein
MRWIGLRTIAVLFSVAPAGAQPIVTEILAKVGAVYKSATQYEIIADSRSTNPTSDEGSGRARFVFQAPNRYRMEGSAAGSAETGAVIVDDGSTIWLFFPQSNQYNSIPVSTLKDEAAGELRQLRPEAQDDSAMSRYRHADSNQQSKYLRDEAIEYSGKNTECYVVSIAEDRGAPEHTWWIDKKTYRILRDDDAEASVIFIKVALGEPVSGDLFKFVPPPGAQEIKSGQ